MSTTNQNQTAEKLAREIAEKIMLQTAGRFTNLIEAKEYISIIQSAITPLVQENEELKQLRQLVKTSPMFVDTGCKCHNCITWRHSEEYIRAIANKD